MAKLESPKPPKAPKRVNIEEAENGYVVSMYDGEKEKRVVCKTVDEAVAAMKEMMGMASEKEKGEESEGSYKIRG
jgi:hypothetical protein